MAFHNELGQKGEQMAVAWLSEKGYTILHRNWRHSHYEIDIIALKNNLLHLIEVKLRSSQKFGMPEENVSRKKISDLLRAADEFLALNRNYKNFQMDILSINIQKNAMADFFLIEDVYL